MSDLSTNKQNISFTFIDDQTQEYQEYDESKEEIYKIINASSFQNESFTEDFLIAEEISYNENFTVKELMTICDYYGLSKELKLNKFNKKKDIIGVLINFEFRPDNYDIVSKRRNLWFYMNEIKNDKFMKKYILW